MKTLVELNEIFVECSFFYHSLGHFQVPISQGYILFENRISVDIGQCPGTRNKTLVDQQRKIDVRYRKAIKRKTKTNLGKGIPF